jgi:hypothetical protein
MGTRSLPAVLLALCCAAACFGQAMPATGPGTAGSGSAWRPVGDAAGGTVAPAPDGSVASLPGGGSSRPAPAGSALSPSGASASSGTGILPNGHGQVWREYDISPYTLRVTSTERPEQAVVDWILRETGYAAWHSEPLGILSATPRTLRVYHTPQMQAVVAELVDRFVRSEAQTSSFALRVITVDHPAWRTRVHRLLKPVMVQSPGASAWLLEKEDAALLLAELQRRADYREHSSPHLLVNNGQSTVVSTVRARPYVRDVIPRADVFPGYEAETGQVDEGFTLEFSPLLSIDGRMIDATIKCDIDQVEEMVAVMLDVPTPAAPRQRTKIEVPQTTQVRFHERFRWPVDEVLLVSVGMVPLPVPVEGKSLVAGLPLPLAGGPPRAELLILVDSRGPVGEPARTAASPQDEPKSYVGRY